MRNERLQRGAFSPARLRLHALATGVLTAYYVAGIVVSTKLSAGRPALELRTQLDDAIPFSAWTVYLYSWVYTAALYPIFVVRSSRIFRRVVTSYFVVLTASFLVFAAMPVTSRFLRADSARLDPSVFSEWAMRLTYAIDPPYNLFPSLHLSIAATAALSAAVASRRYGLYAVPVVLAIAVTICTTKQHFVADGVAGLVLAFATHAVVYRGFRPSVEDEPLTFGWRGAALYLAYHALFYSAFFLAYLAGVPPD